MIRIRPHLWYDREALEAAELYAKTFPNSAVSGVTTLPGAPGGDTEIVSFTVLGQELKAISAGPQFRFTPAISFLVACERPEDVDAYHAVLSDGGSELMPLGEHPFSPRFTWIADRYGLNWQIGVFPGSPSMTTALLFGGEQAGRAEEALREWSGLLPGSSVGDLSHWPAGAAPEVEGELMFGSFSLAGTPFAAMDSRQAQESFTEAISIMVECDTQAEIDALWDALSAVPEAEQCGWLRDRFGVSWQIVPAALDERLRDGTPEQLARVMDVLLPMRKLDVDALERAYAGTES